MAHAADEDYPHLARWVDAYGWVEIGQDEFSHSVVRALQEGGMVWEGAASYPTLAAALAALDAGIGQWLREEMGEE
jgi:hypothetical protein